MFKNLYILFYTDGAFSDVSAVHNDTNVPPYTQGGKPLNCAEKYLNGPYLPQLPDQDIGGFKKEFRIDPFDHRAVFRLLNEL